MKCDYCYEPHFALKICHLEGGGRWWEKETSETEYLCSTLMTRVTSFWQKCSAMT